MSRRPFTDIEALLNDLLNRRERNPDAQHLRSPIDETTFASIAAWDIFLASLEALEHMGGLRIRRRGAGRRADIISVELADPTVAYAHLGRRPASTVAADALQHLRRCPGPPPGSLALIDELEAAWSRGVGRFGFAPGEVAELECALTLVAAMAARQDASPDIDRRSFSRRAVGDSKALDRLGASVVQLLQRLHPSRTRDVGLTWPEVLEELGVVSLAHPLLVSGNLDLDGVPLPPLDYFGAPAEAVERLRPRAPPAYVLTIENLASFVRHAREMNTGRDALVIYTGGFPSRAALRAIVALTLQCDAPVFHWGDIDPGGLRIFAHLESALRETGVRLQPHLMGVSLLLAHGRPDPSVRLERGRSAKTGRQSALADLWSAYAALPEPLRLEQEALDPERPISTCG